MRAGEHSWQGTMQVKPGTVVVVEGEPGATTRGHWWLHAGSGGVIRGIKLEAVDNHVLTAYGCVSVDWQARHVPTISKPESRTMLMCARPYIRSPVASFVPRTFDALMSSA